ncbi:hypothetical protein AT15_05685 [Kosmotoga arenicorallina S304]|uniref:Pyruvate kinase n=1 Tax=Kosmotoga arenicorallina S304 TaxID=1453497 RepID=A0A182C7I3_9BACT|nr:pyruvate kinase [Kosmotoga arenicorallina]OAA31564.1 hypothetical protein AT15_05685 [Kosmotoga arenicorallina S304]
MKGFFVVATIKNTEIVEALINSGAKALRLNSSHLSIVKLLKFLEFFKGKRIELPVYIDLKGNKLRLSRYQPKLKLIAGQQVELVTDSSKRNALLIDIETLKLLVPEQEFSLSDGKIKLKILNVGIDFARALVLKGGIIEGAKGLNISPHPIDLTGITDMDKMIVERTKGYDFVRYALSFAYSAEEIKELKALSGRYVAAKIERELTRESLLKIGEIADELWLCRGDLGAQLGYKGLAQYYRDFNKLIPEFQIPVLMAGGVLEHMVEHPVPTRSEICHLVDLVEHGYKGIVLSDETALGKFPIEVLKTIQEVIL